MRINSPNIFAHTSKPFFSNNASKCINDTIIVVWGDSEWLPNYTYLLAQGHYISVLLFPGISCTWKRVFTTSVGCFSMRFGQLITHTSSKSPWQRSGTHLHNHDLHGTGHCARQGWVLVSGSEQFWSTCAFNRVLTSTLFWGFDCDICSRKECKLASGCALNAGDLHTCYASANHLSCVRTSQPVISIRFSQQKCNKAMKPMKFLMYAVSIDTSQYNVNETGKEDDATIKKEGKKSIAFRQPWQRWFHSFRAWRVKACVQHQW